MKIKHIEGIEQFKTIPPFSIKENRPAFLKEGYDYPSDEQIYEIDLSEYQNDVIEIKCANPECKMSIRLQGSRVDETLSKLKSVGCPVCKQTSFSLYKVMV